MGRGQLQVVTCPPRYRLRSAASSLGQSSGVGHCQIASTRVGIKDTKLSHTGIMKKYNTLTARRRIGTFGIGSTVRKMWLWTTPEGILVGSKLNYGPHRTTATGISATTKFRRRSFL